MKKISTYLSFLVLAIILVSCAPDTTEIDRLAEINAELKAELDSKNKSVEGLLSGLEAVQSDMRNISIREGLLEGLTVSEADLARSPQRQIIEDITLVDELIQRNREKIQELESSVKSSGGKLKEFETVVANMKLQLLDKEKDLASFKDDLVAMEANYASLLEDYQTQTLINGMQDQALHKAYFVYGTKEELMENNVAQKSGGVLGVGKTWELKDDFNKNYFTEVDMRSMDRVPLNVKKLELLSQHPEDSYELISANDMIKELRVTDADSFWSRSRYSLYW